MSGESLSIGMVLVNAHRKRIPTQWSYDPESDPLAISMTISTLHSMAIAPQMGSETFPFARTMLISAFQDAPRVHGRGQVRFWVPTGPLMRVALFVPGRVPVVFSASIQAVSAFAAATLAVMPVCAAGYCEHPQCAECAWVRRRIPFCPCGSPGCFYHRPQ
jgi:hypothetical protein